MKQQERHQWPQSGVQSKWLSVRTEQEERVGNTIRNVQIFSQDSWLRGFWTPFASPPTVQQPKEWCCCSPLRCGGGWWSNCSTFWVEILNPNNNTMIETLGATPRFKSVEDVYSPEKGIRIQCHPYKGSILYGYGVGDWVFSLCHWWKGCRERFAHSIFHFKLLIHKQGSQDSIFKGKLK